jgi:hypothetical protein
MRLIKLLLGPVAVLAVLAVGSADAASRPPPSVPKPPPSRGAPGPIIGVGLPFLAVAGVYWLIRRRSGPAHSELKGYRPAAQDGADGVGTPAV